MSLAVLIQKHSGYLQALKKVKIPIQRKRIPPFNKYSKLHFFPLLKEKVQIVFSENPDGIRSLRIKQPKVTSSVPNTSDRRNQRLSPCSLSVSWGWKIYHSGSNAKFNNNLEYITVLEDNDSVLISFIIILQNLRILHIFFHMFKYYINKILTDFFKRKIKGIRV
jgi:hypothetical protein